MKHVVLLLTALALGCVTPYPAASAASYHVRSDGGDASQCTGNVDAPYQGSGGGQACAWSHPFQALDAGGQWRIQGGDTLVIHGGSYAMGFGASNTGWCEAEGAFDCHLPPLPSGPDAQHPTRLVGAGWDQGCASRPELWGTQRSAWVLDLRGTSNALIACLEITDHSGCVEFHADASTACQRDAYPYGDWAAVGIVAADSASVTLQNLNIHGLAVTGVQAGRLRDWQVDDLRIAGSGWAGWDGDIDGADANAGELRFRHWIVEWNGCAESYPGQQYGQCWAQTAGGYGDGVGTGSTGGHWIIEDSVFRHNTSDGLDLLYVREPGSLIEIRRVMAYSNAGDQLKVNGTTRIENSVAVSECGFFEGKSYTYHVDACRAGGSALALNLRMGTSVSLVSSTVAGQGDCLLIVECDDGLCNGSEQVVVQSNVFQGATDFLDPSDTTCYVWLDHDGYYQTQMDYNVISGTKLGAAPLGSHDMLSDAQLMDARLASFDGRLRAGSPAVDSGLPVGGLFPGHDLLLAPRPVGAAADRGAYERGGAAAPDIRVNAGDGPLSLGSADNVMLTLSLDPASAIGQSANWWVLAETPLGWYGYVYPNWRYATHPAELPPGYVSPLFGFNGFEILSATGLPAGHYSVNFGVDSSAGAFADLERVGADSVDVDVTP